MRWLDERRYGALTVDRCETCGRQLRERERIELAETFAPPDGLPMAGGSAAAIYCCAHAPEHAMKQPPPTAGPTARRPAESRPRRIETRRRRKERHGSS